MAPAGQAWRAPGGTLRCRLPAPGRQGHLPADQRCSGPSGRRRHRGPGAHEPARPAAGTGRLQRAAAGVRQAAVPALGDALLEYQSQVLTYADDPSLEWIGDRYVTAPLKE